MAIYIQGIGSVSPQRIDTGTKEIQFLQSDSNRLSCLEPDYKDLVPPMQLRRMSKVVRMGVASAKQALKDAGIETPHIITLGTAYGCLADTENFLEKLLTQEETMLTPTAFIQSTHNTVSGQIALLTNCQGHNFTFVHRGHSFETSLQETMMWLEEHKANEDFSVLTGGIDELTNHSFDIMSRFGTYKHDEEIGNSFTEGTIAGEGAHLFIAGNVQTANSYAKCLDVMLCADHDIEKQLKKFLKHNHIAAKDIDTCLVGLNGDSRYDETIVKNISSLSHAQLLGFKKWCGEFPTSNSFAFILACLILRNQQIPKELYLNPSGSNDKAPENVLIYNHYKNKYHSFILMQRL